MKTYKRVLRIVFWGAYGIATIALMVYVYTTFRREHLNELRGTVQASCSPSLNPCTEPARSVPIHMFTDVTFPSLCAAFAMLLVMIIIPACFYAGHKANKAKKVKAVHA